VRRVALLAAAGLLAVSLTSCRASSGNSITLTAYFPRTVSLYPSSGVRVLGLPAGKVTKVTVDGERVKVDFRVSASVPVPRDAEATIVPFSLIGERYIQLTPAWKNGEARMADGAVIPMTRTHIPVEPDEALAAVKKFLDTLDPDATGRLIKNLADDVKGNGASLNTALKGVAGLTSTLADKDDELVSIIDHFDAFTSTLRTREAQLGKVMDGFAQTTSLLAQERSQIEALVSNLAGLSTTGFDLVSEHGTRLDRDITVLARVLQSVSTNIDTVIDLLDSGPLLVAGPDLQGTSAGMAAAYDEPYHHLDLRPEISPAIGALFSALGLPALTVCLPVDVSCTPGPVSIGSASANQAALSTAPSTPTSVAPPAAAATVTPIDSIVGLLGSSDTGPAAVTPARAGSKARSGNALTRLARLFMGAIG
jgi:phospholipid/cholesterol/gamma-HCH transport system substrate-binding protein